MSTLEEPTPSRPWRRADGPPPQMWSWPHAACPALEVWSAGKWRYAPVRARQNWPDGRVAYVVEVDLRGTTSVTTVTYPWPQPGLRKAHGSAVEPSLGVDEAHLGDLPRRPPRRR